MLKMVAFVLAVKHDCKDTVVALEYDVKSKQGKAFFKSTQPPPEPQCIYFEIGELKFSQSCTIEQIAPFFKAVEAKHAKLRTTPGLTDQQLYSMID